MSDENHSAMLLNQSSYCVCLLSGGQPFVSSPVSIVRPSDTRRCSHKQSNVDEMRLDAVLVAVVPNNREWFKPFQWMFSFFFFFYLLGVGGAGCEFSTPSLHSHCEPIVFLSWLAWSTRARAHTHARTHTRTHTHVQTGTLSHTCICLVLLSFSLFSLPRPTCILGVGF